MFHKTVGISKLIEANRTHIQFGDMLESVNGMLQDFFGLKLKPITENGDSYVLISSFSSLTYEDSDRVHFADVYQFPLLAAAVGILDRSPLGKSEIGI